VLRSKWHYLTLVCLTTAVSPAVSRLMPSLQPHHQMRLVCTVQCDALSCQRGCLNALRSHISSVPVTDREDT
jgi:hypothetical protein